MRCVQMQEMPPNPTHWTFSGLFSFFLDMFLLHTADSCCLETLCFQEVSFLFSSSVSESRTVWVFVVTDQKCLGCVAFAATPGSIPDAEPSCHILLSHPVLCQRLSLLHNKYFKKMHQEKVRGQGHYDLTPVPFLWVNKHKVSCSRRCVPPQALQFHWCWASGDCRCTLCQSSPSILFLLELIHWNHTCWYCDNLLFLHVAACQAVRQLS